MKRIGLTQRLVQNQAYPESRQALDLRWNSFLENLDCLPLPLSYCSSPKAYLEELKLDGIILTGGNDLSCFAEDPLSQKRDQFEKLVLEFAVEQKIPLLGVCRGLQFVAHYFDFELEEVSGHAGLRHPIRIEDNSEYSEPLSSLETVNSYHNYSISGSNPEFSVIATDRQGKIEAMQHKHLPLLAIMWHPEREEPFNQADLKLFQQFFRA